MKTSFLLTGLAAATVAFARVYEGVSEEVAVRSLQTIVHGLFTCDIDLRSLWFYKLR